MGYVRFPPKPAAAGFGRQQTVRLVAALGGKQTLALADRAGVAGELRHQPTTAPKFRADRESPFAGECNRFFVCRRIDDVGTNKLPALVKVTKTIVTHGRGPIHSLRAVSNQGKPGLSSPAMKGRTLRTEVVIARLVGLRAKVLDG